MVRRFILTTAACLAGLAGGAERARAQEDCALPKNAVILTGSMVLDPLFARLGDRMQTAADLSIYYVNNIPTCSGAKHVMDGKDLGGRVARRYDAMGVQFCALPAGAKADAWVSDLPLTDCFDGKKPGGYAAFPGPIQVLTLLAPKWSPQDAITMEEAYFTFGFGTNGYKGQKVAPWTDASFFALPGPNTSPQILWAKFMRLPGPTAMKGVDALGTDMIVPALLAMETGGDGAIGVSASQHYDGGTPANRTLVKALAVQDFKQKRAFYPDSSPNSFDKRNVRDGHYSFWAPIQLATKIDNLSRPAGPRVTALINYLQLEQSLHGVNMVDVMIQEHLVPGCAMRVKRDPESGEQKPYTPPPGTACGCYMEERISPGSSGCTPCKEDRDCPKTAFCGSGFCE